MILFHHRKSKFYNENVMCQNEKKRYVDLRLSVTIGLIIMLNETYSSDRVTLPTLIKIVSGPSLNCPRIHHKVNKGKSCRGYIPPSYVPSSLDRAMGKGEG